MAQVAANTQSFSGLPDDCAGDVLEFLTMTTLERTELLEVVTDCSSPEACAWMRTVVDDIVVVSAHMSCLPSVKIQIYCASRIR